ncbi:efflux RND transporter periplasmic adaptor subunit [Rhodanobacter sp. OR444]|uniref:efflux RND transporter periplasmic adaptor subunit n=1 Tax=Rhodanobacter sp. OR444 TaxID=1076525 RepID=UPI00040787A1|nr:efflux RND transporter periplasmic adaptor subunit [Rhodanobacter sp. OR444]
MHAFFHRTLLLLTEHYVWIAIGVVLVALLIFSVHLGRHERHWSGRLLAPLNWYSRNLAARRLTINILGAALILWAVNLFTLWVTPTLTPSQLFTSPVEGPQPVRITQAREGVLDEVASYTGNVQPWEDDVIYARVDGWVQALNVYPGDVVHHGEVLATLDLSNLQPALEKAQAQVTFQQAEFQRDQQLFKGGAISAARFDGTRMRYQAAQAELHQVETDISYAALRSPLDGVIAKRHVYPGVYVHKGEMVVKVDDLHRVRVQFNVAESDLQWVHPGTVVYLRFEQLDDAVLRHRFPKAFVQEPDSGTGVLRAVVAAVFPQEDPQTHTGLVEVRIDNPDLLLRENTYVVGDLVRRSVDKGVLIPTSALTTEPGGKQVVFVVSPLSEQGTVEARDVTVGLRGPEQVQIVKGVAAGEFVVSQGNRQLVDGQTVDMLNQGGGQ